MHHENGQAAGTVERCVSTFVAVLFFVPRLVILWFPRNVLFAFHQGWRLPVHVLTGAIAAAALLGFLALRATPAVFGWFAHGFLWFGRFWW